jgi:hypothetical protein
MSISTNIRLVKTGNEHWVSTTIDGLEQLERQGPFADKTEAEAAARWIAGVCQTIFRSGVVVAPMPGEVRIARSRRAGLDIGGLPPMGEIVSLNKAPFDLATDAGHAFVVDATRAGEGLITDQELKEKYELTPADWRNITRDKALGRAVRAERERRMLDGTAARESAARHFVKAPTILAGIMESAESNPRHVIEAAKEIRAVAVAGNADRPRESERFVIRIDLTAGGGEVETYDRTIDIKVNEDKGAEGKLDDQW